MFVRGNVCKIASSVFFFPLGKIASRQGFSSPMKTRRKTERDDIVGIFHPCSLYILHRRVEVLHCGGVRSCTDWLSDSIGSFEDDRKEMIKTQRLK